MTVYCLVQGAIRPMPHVFHPARSWPAETHGRQTSRASHRPVRDLISALPKSVPRRSHTTENNPHQDQTSSSMSLSFFLRGDIFSTTRRNSAEQNINRQPAGDQHQPRQRRRSPVAKQDHEYYARAHDVQRRHNRITERLVRTLRQRLHSAQAKNANDGEDVKNQNGGDDIVQQIAVKVSISSGERIVSPGQNQKRGPHPL